MVETDGPLLSEPGNETKMQAMRRRARDMVEGDMDTWFEYSLLIVIFGNVLALVVSSVRAPGNDDWCALACSNHARLFLLCRACQGRHMNVSRACGISDE